MPSHFTYTTGASQETCIYCDGANIFKKGRRKKKHEIIQLWYCKDCTRVFTPQRVKGKTYPLRIMLEGLSLYCLGWTLKETSAHLKERFGLIVPQRTLSAWLREFRDLTTYTRIRPDAKSLFSPHQIIRKMALYHRQVYLFRIHQAKLALLLKKEHALHPKWRHVKTFLERMVTDCPHNLFTKGLRASDIKAKFNIEKVQIREKQNTATRTANLALQAVSRNKMRHEELQKFILSNDSVTIATEVPIYLLPEDIKHMESELGFEIPLRLESALTGHIDALQIRNGAIHILDYKPNAIKVKPIAQLTLYALALSRRTGIRLFDFKCGWFDEKHYFEFFPLHIVYKPKKKVKEIKVYSRDRTLLFPKNDKRARKKCKYYVFKEKPSRRTPLLDFRQEEKVFYPNIR